MLTVSVLGPVELRRDGELLPLRPGKTTEVLIRLALDAGTTVRAERLIEDLWGDAAVSTSRNTLQTKISRLRRELGDAATLTTGPAGYALELAPHAVDALEVVRLADQADRELDGGDAAAARATSAAALALYRGEVLGDAGDGDWLVPHRVRLDDARLQLLETRLAADVQLGAAGAVAGELEALVTEHPLREGLAALLVTALYRDGRQADALAAYARVREQLAEELGLEPGPALQVLERQVLDQDPGLGARAPRGRTPGNLPALASPLVGRMVELDALTNEVASARLVTVVGAAGVGKTRLATAAARTVDRVAGAWLVRLDTATGTSVVPAVGDALDVVGATVPLLVEHLRGSDALLVLDNCEHVVEAVADLVPDLLDAAPALTILCTSQVPLGLDGEVVLPLAPLSPEDAIELFSQRARAQRPALVLDEPVMATVRELCAALDGLPLAIELAAARARTLSVDDIARRLDDRFTLLRDPSSHRPERQRALSAAIAWSYDLLFPDDQAGVGAVASFAGGAGLDALEHVLDALGVPSDASLDVVGRIVDRSLVSVEAGPDGSLRYRMLDSVRTFGRERMREQGQLDVAAAAHADWYARAADRAATAIRGPSQAEHLAVARDERADVDRAIGWAVTHDPPTALRIASGFGWAWMVIGDGAAGASRLRAALAAVGDDATSSDRARAWALVAWLDAGNDVDDAEAAALAARDAAGDDGSVAEAQLAHAFVLIQRARVAEALALLAECRTTHARVDRTWDEAASWVLTAHAALLAGDAALAADAGDHAAPLIAELGDDWGTGHLEAVLGQVARAEGRLADATTHLRRAADAAGRLGFATSEGWHLVNLGRALQQAGALDDATAALERAVEIGRTTAELRLAALARVRLGRVRRAAGDVDGARDALVRADDWYRTAGGGEGAALAACLLAAVDAADGVPDAVTQLEAVLESARAGSDVEVEVLALDALARARTATGDASAAGVLLADADARMAGAAPLLVETDRVDADAARAALRP